MSSRNAIFARSGSQFTKQWPCQYLHSFKFKGFYSIYQIQLAKYIKFAAMSIPCLTHVDSSMISALEWLALDSSQIALRMTLLTILKQVYIYQKLLKINHLASALSSPRHNYFMGENLDLCDLFYIFLTSQQLC